MATLPASLGRIARVPARGAWRALRAVGRQATIRRFRRDKSGATVVGFALIALPFFALLFAVLETGLTFFATQTIEDAVARGARLIRTGQAQEANISDTDFKRVICEEMSLIFDCEAKLRVDVRTYTNFTSIDLGNPIDEDGNLIDDFDYDPGEGGELVVVRAFYEWPVFTNLLGLGLATLGNGKHLIAATTAFRNEPF
ncbi:MAG: pilus assembly protein [Bauldia sp.]|nr:pilus assembly protein [Bauldia sp.]